VIEAFDMLRSGLAVSVACQALGVPRASIYRARCRRRGVLVRTAAPRPRPPLSLSDVERERLLTVLNSGRFADMAPAAIYATLLDEGQYLASVRTMYRVLAAEGQSLERRRQRVHPAYAKPELLATGPREVWSWDITKLKGPVRWSVYQLYVILDIFSRYVVGWMVALRESAELAEQFIADTLAKQQIAPGTSPCTPIGARACAPSPSPRFWSILMLPEPTAAHTSRMTTRTRSRSSRPSSTDPNSPSASAPSKTPGLTASVSSTGTTTRIATAASA
jgi:transposase InsO family protein